MVKFTVSLVKKKRERRGEKKGREKEKKKTHLKPMGVVKPGCHNLLLWACYLTTLSLNLTQRDLHEFSCCEKEELAHPV